MKVKKKTHREVHRTTAESSMARLEAFRLKQIDYDATNVNYNFNVCMCYIAYNILSRPMQNVSYVSEVL